jgi:hypothetical protein
MNQTQLATGIRVQSVEEGSVSPSNFQWKTSIFKQNKLIMRQFWVCTVLTLKRTDANNLKEEVVVGADGVREELTTPSTQTVMQ